MPKVNGGERLSAVLVAFSKRLLKGRNGGEGAHSGILVAAESAASSPGVILICSSKPWTCQHGEHPRRPRSKLRHRGIAVQQENLSR